MPLSLPILDRVSESSQIMGAGLIDLDVTFGVQLLIFLTLLFVMKAVAYDPFLKLAASRQDATDGARKVAETAGASAKELGTSVEAQLSRARADGVTLRNELKLSGEKQAQTNLSSVREEIEKKTQSELSELNAARAGARAALGTEARRLGDMIADRILGGGA